MDLNTRIITGDEGVYLLTSRKNEWSILFL